MRNYNNAVEELSSLIAEGENNYNLDLSEIKTKLESIKQMLSSDTLKIVLLGSFSDGKTTTIAGMLGKLLDNMKIDQDESSDELTFHKIDGLKDVEIVDTPGLFGSKEKQVTGENISYSKITERYISEAHIVLYVTDAVDPVKDSHTDKLRWVLKDLGKLQSTIFVINKMDDAGYDLTDETDFQRGASIKKKFLIDGLTRNLGLSSAEASNLNVICISADPKGKGLSHWFSKPDDYAQRSHIKVLKDTVDKVAHSSNTGALNEEAILSSFKDVSSQVNALIGESSEKTDKAIQDAQKTYEDIQFELNDLNKQLLHNKKILSDSILAYRTSLINTINNTGMESFSNMLDEEIGIQENKISGKIFQQRVEAILSECGNNNNTTINGMVVSYEKHLSGFDTSLKIIGSGTKMLKNVNITGGLIKSIRNIILPSFKFKPWQAVNIAGKLSKGIAIVGIAIDAILFWRKKKAEKEFLKSRNELKDSISAAFDEIAKMYATNEDYYRNFAPSYLDMVSLKDERKQTLDDLVSQSSQLSEYKDKLTGWLNSVRD